MLKRILTVVMLLCCAVAARAQWEFANAEPLPFGAGLRGQNLAIDESGTLHAMFRSGSSVLYYSRASDAPDWSGPEQVNDSLSPSQFGDYAIAWNPGASQPLVTYVSANRVWLAQRQTGGTWTRTMLGDADEFAMTPDVAANGSGEIFVVFITDVNDSYQLTYAFFDGATWTTDVIEANLGDFGAGAEPNAGLQDNGAAHVAFRAVGATGYKVQHATNNESGGTEWVLTDLQAPHAENYPGDLVVELDGTVHCVTQGSDGFGMPAPTFYHKRTADGSWSFGVTASGPLNAGDPTVAFDTQSGGHAMWLPVEGNFYTGELFYSGATSAWAPDFVHDNVSGGASFVIGPDNFGHILVETGGGQVVYLKSEQPLAGEIPEPDLTIVPSTLDFDSVEVGEDSILAVRLENTGDATLTISAFDVTGTAFSGPPQWIVVNLGPGAFMTTEVQFTPLADQNYLGRVLVWSNAASSPDTIHLSGRGYLPTDVPGAQTPNVFALYPLYPNPFNGGVNVSFELPREMSVELGVFDVLGRRVETLTQGTLSAGAHVLQWNGDERAAGVYLFILEAGEWTVVRKAMYLK